MKTWSLRFSLSICSILLCGLVGQSQILFEFASESEFSNNFVESGFSAGPDYFHSTAPGVGTVPGRVESGFYTETLVLNRPLGFAGESTLAMSTSFGYRPYTYSGRVGNELLRIGVVDSISGDGIYPFGQGAYLAVGLAVGPDGISRTLLVQSKPSSAQRATTDYSASFSLDPGIHQLAGEWTLLGSDTFQYSVSLYSQSADGTGLPILLARFSGSVTNAALASDSAIFAALRFARSEPFMDWIDNVAIIPELAPSALLLPSLLLLAAFSRRRLRAARRFR